MNWTNQGVTYLYEPCSVAMALLDAGNNVVGNKSWLSGVNPRLNWAPGQPIAVSSYMSFDSVPAGTYQLVVGLFSSTNQAQPDFMIGNQGRTANGWYVITNISLDNVAPPATNATSITAALIGSHLILSWPADHIGWTLQTQTNVLATNWVVIPNSLTTNRMYISISPTNPAAFFQLKY